MNVASHTKKPGTTRIQREKRQRILASALDVFSTHGFRGSTIDQIADAAGMSKPNLLYYFSSKEDIHRTLIEWQMEKWLSPLKALNENGDPLKEVCGYIRRKLEMARDFPKESRLFANEILQGAPRIREMLTGELNRLVEEKAAVIQNWIDREELNPCDARHLLFAIWATTQHYADFDVQVRIVLHLEEGDQSHFEEAARFLENLFCKGLKRR